MKQLNKWNEDTTLVIKERLKEVLNDIREKEQARLKKELLKELSKGQSLFKNICQACHGPDGKGIQSMAPPLNRSEWVTGDKHRLTAIVLFGLTGPVEVHGHVYDQDDRSEEHTSELQSLMRNSYAVFCLKKKKNITKTKSTKT